MSAVPTVIQCPVLIKEKQKPKILNYMPTALLMGFAGVGKTKLSNLLCDTNFESEEGGATVTKNLFSNPVCHGNYPFKLIDTPGCNSTEDTYTHAVQLRCALTGPEINTIFVIVKYNTRPKTDIWPDFKKIVRMLSKYKHKVVAMISCWDLCENKEKLYKEICELFKTHEVSYNVIFYSKYSCPNELSNIMFSCMSNMEKEKLIISDAEFLLHFNIGNTDERFSDHLYEYLTELEYIRIDFYELVESVKKDFVIVNEIDECLLFLLSEFKIELEYLKEKFKQKFIRTYAGSDRNFFANIWILMLEKENIEKCDSFVQIITSHMSYNPFNAEDIRNSIKRCPSCNEVWLKVEGCDDTYCGNIPSKWFDFVDSSNSYKTFSLKRDRLGRVLKENGKLSIQRSETLKVEPKKPEIKNEKNKRMGCGKKLNWSTCPRITDAKMMELFQVKTIEEALCIINQVKFQEQRANYEYNIDTQIYGLSNLFFI